MQRTFFSLSLKKWVVSRGGMNEKWGAGWRIVWVDERKCRGDDAFCMGCFQGVLKKGVLKGSKWGNGKRWNGSSSVQKCEEMVHRAPFGPFFLSPHFGSKVPQRVLWRGLAEKMWNWHFARCRLEGACKWLITNGVKGRMWNCEMWNCEKYTLLKAEERGKYILIIYYYIYYIN